MAIIMTGAAVTAALNEKIKAEAEALGVLGVKPRLALLRVGEKAADLAYERGALKRMDACSIAVSRVVLPEDVSQGRLMAEIEALNHDAAVHGVLIFRPLPKQLDEQAATAALSPAKDVDGITEGSMAGIYSGSGKGFPPCTAEAVICMLEHYGIEIQGKRIAVIGRSLVIGKPVSMLLIGKNATVTVCHTKTADLPAVCRGADILVAAAGRSKTVGAEHVSPGQTVVDVGINTDAEGNLCGDVDFDAVEPIVGAVTPVPGGVGGVTTSVLASHVVAAARRLSAK